MHVTSPLAGRAVGPASSHAGGAPGTYRAPDLPHPGSKNSGLPVNARRAMTSRTEHDYLEEVARKSMAIVQSGPQSLAGADIQLVSCLTECVDRERSEERRVGKECRSR